MSKKDEEIFTNRAWHDYFEKFFEKFALFNEKFKKEICTIQARNSGRGLACSRIQV